jgi:hypothetical protein
MPVLIRGAGSPVTTSVTLRAGRMGADAFALERRPGVAAAAASCAMVENSPHLGHRPYQRAEVAPQPEQR